MNSWNDNCRIKGNSRTNKRFRVILSCLVLEELGKRLFRISHFLTLRAHKVTH